MATDPIQLADINVGSALVENWGRPTAYFQRWLQDNNANITATIAGLQAALADLAAQQAAFDKFQRSSQGTAGLAGGTTSGGAFSFPHSYPSGNPNYYPPSEVYSTIFADGSTYYSHIQVDSIDSTNVNLFVFDASGSLAPDGTQVRVSWHVAGA